MKKIWILFVGIILCFSAIAPCLAAGLDIVVTDLKNKPLKDAVVTLSPSKPCIQQETPMTTVEQKDREFHPLVTVVTVGSKVSFPNKDSVKHHVYSFSETKKIDLPLYKSNTPPPVVMEKSGIVTLGCNIHDWMKAYIFVSETPFFGKSGPKGKISIKNLPQDVYLMNVWHPRMKKAPKGFPLSVDLKQNDKSQQVIRIDIRREFGTQKPSSMGDPDYN